MAMVVIHLVVVPSRLHWLPAEESGHDHLRGSTSSGRCPLDSVVLHWLMLSCLGYLGLRLSRLWLWLLHYHPLMHTVDYRQIAKWCGVEALVMDCCNVLVLLVEVGVEIVKSKMNTLLVTGPYSPHPVVLDEMMMTFGVDGCGDDDDDDPMDHPKWLLTNHHHHQADLLYSSMLQHGDCVDDGEDRGDEELGGGGGEGYENEDDDGDHWPCS